MGDSKLCALEVGAAVSRIDTDLVTLVDEDRNADRSAGLNGCGLLNVGSRVTLYTGLALGDKKLNEYGRLNRENVALPGKDLTDSLLLDEAEVVVKLLLSDRSLIVALHIHEVVKITVVVEILHLLTLDECLLKLSSRVERGLGNTAGDDVSHLGANESRALTGLNVLELNDLHEVALVLKGNAVSEIACSNGCHFRNPQRKDNIVERVSPINRCLIGSLRRVYTP